ncbi:MAG: hypothetical protein QNJ42_19130 [Crocosphaera sp.]|nr:hypothetical protein [Crocosphaera sp.]
MNFPIKPPLYALDPNQINDLVYAKNIHNFIGNWLAQSEHFPIYKGFNSSVHTGLLLFERFTPWFDNWCSNYSTKLYEFYKYISETYYYFYPYFNGYGLLDENYGNALDNELDFNFNIPSILTLTNPTDKLITITYLEKSYQESEIYFNKISNNVELYVKQIIRLSAFSNITIDTDQILFCSMVVNSSDNLDPNQVGIPMGLDYTEMDNYLEQIKTIIDNNFPYLNKRIKQIDYTLNMTSGGQYDNTSGNLTTYLDYQFNYVPNTLLLEDIPDWYYSACLIYANNDYWGSEETINDDLGKELNVIIYTDYLEYDFLFIPTRPEISSNIIRKPIFPDNLETDIVKVLDYLEFCYRSGIGINYIATDYDLIDTYDPIDTFISRSSFTDVNFGIPSDNQFNRYQYLFDFFSTSGWTNTGICNRVNPYLFASVDGITSAYNSLIVGTTSQLDTSDPDNWITSLNSSHGLSRFIYNVFFEISSNTVLLSSEIEEQLITNSFSGTLQGSDSGQRFPINQTNQGISWYAGIAQSEGNLGSFFSKDNQGSNANYEITKTLTFSTYLSDPRTIRSNTDQEIIDFVNNIIVPNYQDNEFMPDSVRIIEIHEALNAGKFANDPNDPEVYRFANLGYYIERIARILGISVDPDGSIRSVRQRAYKDNGETIPPGWPVGQWGRNQGESTEGQLGGNVQDDKDGITYPVIANKFTLDQFTGKPDKIVEGGYVLCENLFQYLETLKDDLDKTLGLQSAGANSFPLPQGNGDVSYEGLSTLIQENSYMISQLSRLISSAQISSLVTQAVVSELLAHCGVPTTIKELKVKIGDNEETFIPYPAITENSPSQFDQTLWLLSNLAPLLGGKINIRQDRRVEDS